MGFRQLYDPKTNTHYAIDSKAMIFRMICEEIDRKLRLKPYHTRILEILFLDYPSIVPYERIKSILENSRLVCSDETRLHRKVSELRKYLTGIHPNLNHNFLILIRNM